MTGTEMCEDQSPETCSTNDAGEKVGVPISDTLAERGNRYGNFTKHASISQQLLRNLLSHASLKGTYLESVHREALQMICHKLARIVNGDPNYDDSWRDIAGYATLVEKHINGVEV
jgi:hypothetical protein